MTTPLSRDDLHPFDFEPTYHRVAQTNKWNSAMACIASVVQRPIEEVQRLAVNQFNRPATGRRSVPRKLIPEFFEHYGWWITSRFREAQAVNDLPDLALILLSKNPDQFALFHRQKFAGGRLPVSYLINPAHVPVDQHYVLDADVIASCKYLHICSMAQYMKDFW